MSAKSHLHVRQSGSVIGQVEHTRKIIKGLGLRGPGTEVTVANTPSFRGMVKKVLHLVQVAEIDAPATRPTSGRAAPNPAPAPKKK